MGVCIGTCSKVEKNSPEINPNDQKEIKNSLDPNALPQEDCNLKTTENEHFHQKDKDKENQGEPEKNSPAEGAAFQE